MSGPAFRAGCGGVGRFRQLGFSDLVANGLRQRRHFSSAMRPFVPKGALFRGIASMASPKTLQTANPRFTYKRDVHTQPIPQELFMQPPTHVTTLPSGLRVASQWTPDETATVGVFLDSGSRYETKETNGVAHFLEHMVFKGTQRRTRVELEKEIENMGAHLNAYTAREQTVYYAKAFKQDLEQAMDILSDILINSKFDRRAIEEERHVILREMEEVEKCYEEVIFDRLHMTAFRDSPLGLTILGPPENIKAIQREWILDYIRENYTADRMVIAGAGDFDHKWLVELASKYFHPFKQAKPSPVSVRKEKPYFCGSELLHRTDDVPDLGYVALAYEAVGWNHPAQPVFMLMQSIIGSYDRMNEGLVPGRISGNRTINNVANKEHVGCAENFCGFNTCYKDTGLFGFFGVAPRNALFHLIEEVMFSICGLAHSVTEEEVQMAKQNLKNNLFGSLDTTTAICEDIGRQILVYGRRIPLPEMFKRIDYIGAEEVRRVAWEKLYDTEVALTAIGQCSGVLPYNIVRRQTRLNRW